MESFIGPTLSRAAGSSNRRLVRTGPTGYSAWAFRRHDGGRSRAMPYLQGGGSMIIALLMVAFLVASTPVPAESAETLSVSVTDGVVSLDASRVSLDRV